MSNLLHPRVIRGRFRFLIHPNEGTGKGMDLRKCRDKALEVRNVLKGNIEELQFPDVFAMFLIA